MVLAYITIGYTNAGIRNERISYGLKLADHAGTSRIDEYLSLTTEKICVPVSLPEILGDKYDPAISYQSIVDNRIKRRR
jgi:hypothetical protein